MIDLVTWAYPIDPIKTWCRVISIMLVAGVLLLCPSAHGVERLPAQDIQRIELATLVTTDGTKAVQLPHQLQNDEFNRSGEVVRYQMQHHLNEVPPAAIGIMVPKLSLSGQLIVNGHFVDSCGNGALENLRCLHQPIFFEIPAVLWQKGENQIEIQIYANARQPNGLSAIYIGEANQLYAEKFQISQWLRSDILYGMTWLASLMGVIALSVSMKLKEESMYKWFGLTSLTNAISSLNYFVISPLIDPDGFIWLMYSTRMIAIPLGLLAYAAMFRKEQPWAIKTLMAYIPLSMLVLLLSDSSRPAIIMLSAPFVPISAIVFYRSISWLRSEFDGLRLTTFIIMAAMLCAGFYDWFRLAGQTDFDGFFLAPYAFTLMLFGLGTLLIRELALGLIQARSAKANLERQAAERMAFEMTEHIPVGTFTLRQHPKEQWQHFDFISERFLQLTSLNKEELLENPKLFTQNIHPNDLGIWNQVVNDARASLHHCAVLIRMKVREEWRWMNVESVPRQLPDGSILWEGVLIDETERVENEEAHDKLQLSLQRQRIEESRIEEREQLLRDMHDGFGSQLATVRMLAEKGRISPDQFPRYLQEISADLHLVVDIMGQSDVSLDVAMQDLRHRLERRRIMESGKHLHWHISLEGMPPLSSRDILNTLRLVQEAINNALKHAHAQNIWIDAVFNQENQMLRIAVRDDGVGMPENLKPGRGLNNMRHRAREMNGELRIENTSQGVTVCLMVKKSSTAS